MITKDDIRITKGSYNTDGKFWYYPEIRKKSHLWIFGDSYSWEHVYAVNYKTLSWSSKLHAISPHNEFALQTFLKECYDWAKYYESQENWKLTNYEEYHKVYELSDSIRRNHNNNVYFK